MYYAYIHSYIEYMLPSGGFAKTGLVSRIHRLHRRALKLALGSEHLNAEILKSHNMLTLEQLVQLNSCLLIHQVSESL